MTQNFYFLISTVEKKKHLFKPLAYVKRCARSTICKREKNWDQPKYWCTDEGLSKLGYSYPTEMHGKLERGKFIYTQDRQLKEKKQVT